MQLRFTRRGEGNTRLILIFPGWSTDEAMYSHIHAHGWDTAVVTDYSSPAFENALLKTYRTIYLYAWSMGVQAAEMALSGGITAAFAINGTAIACHDAYGIPQRIFDATNAGLTEHSLRKFHRRMVSCADDFRHLTALLPQKPDIARLRAELSAMRDSGTVSPKLPWKRAYIALSDAIIPASSQHRFWSELSPGTKIYQTDSPHFSDMADIVRATIPDPGVVGKRFERALQTYDSEADAQRKMAAELTAMLLKANPPQNGRVLEIGVGSGLFTSYYAPAIKPVHTDYVELYDINLPGAAQAEDLIVGDAEAFMEQTDRQYDMILSAAAMQWFVNPEHFISDAARRLRSGGILACSTFLPGNLGELDAIRPAPIVYPSENDIRSFIGKNFRTCEMRAMEIPVRFGNARKAISHLRHTGVAGSAPSSARTADILKALASTGSEKYVTLTYRALLFTAVK